MDFELYKPSVVQRVLAEHGLKIKKAFGQNFLVDRHVLEKICSAASLQRDDFILEVGPGLGTLADFGSDVVKRWVAVELDRDLRDHLDQVQEEHPNFQVLYGDFLKLSLPDLTGTAEYKFVANLPYYITTPILSKIIASKTNWKQLVVMVQLEVARRLTADPGTKDYGSLSLYLQYYGNIELVAKVSRHSFLPEPDVDSAVVSIKRHVIPPVVVSDDEALFNLIRAAFHQRRKTLVNSIATAPYVNYTPTQIRAALAELGIGQNRRGETLSLAEFAQLSEAIGRLCNTPRSGIIRP